MDESYRDENRKIMTQTPCNCIATISFHISNCTMSPDRSAAASDASSNTCTIRTRRIHPSGSSSARDGISWECSNLLHFEDISRELDEEEEMEIDQLQNSSSSLPLPPRAVESDGTLSRISSVDTFRSRVIEKHTSSGSLSRVTSLSANASNGSSSLRSYLSFSSGPDAAAGPARRLGTVTTSNANFNSQANNNDQQRQRNAAASSAGRSMLGRN